MKRDDGIRDCLNENLDGLCLSQQRHYRLIETITGGRKVKRKLTASLVLAMVFVLITAVALAWGLNYSPKATAELTARDALMKQYGLTLDMVRMFDHEETTLEDHQTVTVYYAACQSSFINGEAMGTYTVVTDEKGGAAVSWSHDDVDPTVWQSGDLTSPVWGAPQLQQLLDRYAAYREWWAENGDMDELPLSEQETRFEELAELMAPLQLNEGPVDPNAALQDVHEDVTVNVTPTPIPEETPAPTARPGDITAQEATALAKQAMADAYRLSPETLDTYETEVFYQADQDGNCEVMFYGIESMGHVILRPENGEIQEVVLDSGVGGKG